MGKDRKAVESGLGDAKTPDNEVQNGLQTEIESKIRAHFGVFIGRNSSSAMKLVPTNILGDDRGCCQIIAQKW